MLCRVAEDIYWMSRYVERAIAVGRLIDVTWHLELDLGEPDSESRAFWLPLLGAVAGRDSEVAHQDVRQFLAFDVENPDSLVSCVRQARAAARGVRESISSEMWEQLNTLYLSLVDPEHMPQAEDELYAFYRRVREGAQFFQGLADNTLAHDETWEFINLGKYLERASNVARVLNLQAHLLHRPLDRARGADDTVRWLALLRSCGCAEAYAHYYSVRVEPAHVVEFMLLNPVFPQSVRFSLGAAWDSLRQVASRGADGHGGTSPAVRAMGLLDAQLEHAAVDEVLEEGLEAFLQDVQGRIVHVSEEITRSYMRAEPQPGRLVGVARAAMIMAAQQQQ
jgi:uncharacterized alpha-E superfamily protein